MASVPFRFNLSGNRYQGSVVLNNGDSSLISTPKLPLTLAVTPGAAADLAAATCVVEFTCSSEAEIAAETARWIPWALGPITGDLNPVADYFEAFTTAIRVKATAGSFTIDVAA